MKEEEWLRNREKKHLPKLGLFWCKCDRNHVGAGGKCGVCGKKDYSHRFKK